MLAVEVDAVDAARCMTIPRGGRASVSVGGQGIKVQSQRPTRMRCLDAKTGRLKTVS